MARWIRAALIAATFLALPTADALAVTMPGPNGQLVFTSGRDHLGTVLSDMKAQIWLLSGPNGQASRFTARIADNDLHHRHAAWSPDRTKIAFAMGPMGFSGPWDIWVQDVTSPASPPVQITNTALNEDRPSWSADGTRLAYAKQVAATTWNIVQKQASLDADETIVAVDASVGMGASGQFSRPQWNPEGTQIFYGRAVGVGTYDIYRAPANGSNVIGAAIVAESTNDYQPSLSADGDTLCFTRQGGSKDIYRAPSTGGTGTAVVAALGDEYECTWSPDGTKIAFVRGGFDQGEIRMANSNGPSTQIGEIVTNVGGRFDGNPEWTFNPAPSCADGQASVDFNSFVSIPLSCTDPPDPPETAPDTLDADLVTPPQNGILGEIDDNRVIYTPNVDFSGQDNFSINSNDGTSSSNTGTISITVAPRGPDDGGVGGDGPNVDALAVSAKRWKRGNRLPRISQNVPTGTTITVQLSEAGQVALRFNRARPGRRVRGRCVRQTRSNRSRPRCKRFVRAGTLRFAGRQGVNTIRFQGRLTRRKRLPLGSYRMSARLTADGETSSAKTVSFRIVRGR